jgi:hypothetical protein
MPDTPASPHATIGTPSTSRITRQVIENNGNLYAAGHAHGLDHNIDSLCATASDFERLLEVFLQQNNYSGSTHNYHSSFEDAG